MCMWMRVGGRGEKEMGGGGEGREKGGTGVNKRIW